MPLICKRSEALTKGHVQSAACLDCPKTLLDIRISMLGALIRLLPLALYVRVVHVLIMLLILDRAPCCVVFSVVPVLWERACSKQVLEHPLDPEREIFD